MLCSGSLRITVSNNDCGVREYDMERFQLLNHYRYNWPVNVSSTSLGFNVLFWLFHPYLTFTACFRNNSTHPWARIRNFWLWLEMIGMLFLWIHEMERYFFFAYSFRLFWFINLGFCGLIHNLLLLLPFFRYINIARFFIKIYIYWHCNIYWPWPFFLNVPQYSMASV